MSNDLLKTTIDKLYETYGMINANYTREDLDKYMSNLILKAQPVLEHPPLRTNVNQILLIDNRVKNYQSIVNAVNSNTFPIVYSTNVNKTDMGHLVQSLKNVSPQINRIGFCFSSYVEVSGLFLNNKPFFVTNENSNALSENVQWVIDVIKKNKITNVDFMACNTLQYSTWRTYYDILKSNTGVIVGASDDKTGNLKYGGDWIMETTNEDVDKIYFTSSIGYYSFLLDNPEIITTHIIQLDAQISVKFTIDTENVFPVVVLPDARKAVYLANNASLLAAAEAEVPPNQPNIDNFTLLDDRLTSVFAALPDMSMNQIPWFKDIKIYDGDTLLYSKADIIGLVFAPVPNFLYLFGVNNTAPVLNDITNILASVDMMEFISDTGPVDSYAGWIETTDGNFYYDLSFGDINNLQNPLFHMTGFTNIDFPLSVTAYVAPCFKEDTQILTDRGYVAVQELRRGDNVQTLLDGFVPINMIGMSQLYNSGNDDRNKDRLYRCSRENYPELVGDDLILTGCHSVLVDFFTDKQRETTQEVLGNIYITDKKYRLPACVDERAVPYEVEGTFPIYHIALDNNNYFANYGIYANGILVESCSKRYLKEISDMKLIK